MPLIFLIFLLPGVAYGTVAGTVKSAKDVVQGMSKAMSGMGYYIVMAFFAALFTTDFGRSNLGALFALKGATLLQALQLPGQVTIVGIIVTAMVNLLIGSRSSRPGRSSCCCSGRRGSRSGSRGRTRTLRQTVPGGIAAPHRPVDDRLPGLWPSRRISITATDRTSFPEACGCSRSAHRRVRSGFGRSASGTTRESSCCC
ncbi:MAG TPA: AbgT family transporter, partial [Thermomicrobiales bacterium]|nr:AbgT family transporter [Thermomicrobiales bacterium]